MSNELNKCKNESFNLRARRTFESFAFMTRMKCIFMACSSNSCNSRSQPKTKGETIVQMHKHIRKILYTSLKRFTQRLLLESFVRPRALHTLFACVFFCIAIPCVQRSVYTERIKLCTFTHTHLQIVNMTHMKLNETA